MKKRLLSILLALVMALSLLPTTALAANEEPASIKYGTYGSSTVWTEDEKCAGSIVYEDKGVKLSKVATPTANDNEYEITLTVETTTTSSTTAASAATVLVIDTSGSMEFCAECGAQYFHDRSCQHFSWRDDSVKYAQSRMAAAKAAASSFIETYAGKAEGSGRYLAIVSFSTSASTVLGWTDVSTSAGKTNAKNAVNELPAGGGTNLDAALRTATGLMGDDSVSSLTNKFTVALTDGAPTYYINSRGETVGSGSTGSAEINAATAASAKTLKQLCTLYTVCFGASDDLCWEGGWNGKDGPTVGAFLRDSIATTATTGCAYAYDAANTDELNEAFNNITETITSGISAGTVSDPLPAGGVVIAGIGYAETWELDPDDANTEVSGNTTTYTYTKTYTVTIDPTKTDKEYQPLNGKTTFKSGDTVLEFPVPAGKVTPITYTLTYDANGGSGSPAPQTGSSSTGSYSFTVSNTKPTTDNLHFMGWADSANATAAQYQPEATITLYQANPTKTIYAVWGGHVDNNGDGFCDNGRECLHNHDNEGYCTEKNCNHPHGDNDCCPLKPQQPQPPAKPTDVELSNILSGSFVTVQCISSNGHSDKSLSYGLLPDGYTIGGVEGDAANGYTCKVTFHADVYQAAYNTSTDSKHELEPKEQPVSIVLYWVKETGWTAPDGYAPRFTVTCDGDSSYYTVTYTDGVDGVVVFADQMYYVPAGSQTPAFVGTPKRAGYVFTGWDPAVAETVTGDVTYTAQWRRSYHHTTSSEAKPTLNKADHYAYVVGYPDGTVQPQGAITRAEVATIFFRLLSDETRDQYWTKDNAYTDVKAGDWFNNAVSTLSNAGIINGYPDGTFRPNAPITRAEMAKVIAMFAELNKDSEGFKDIAGHWAEAYIKLAAGNGWIAGYPDGTFRPDQYITRAETMTMINRVLERVPSTEKHLLAYEVMLTFPDNQPGDWYYIAVQEATNSHTYERYATEKNGDEQWIKLIDNYDWTKLEF